MKMLKAMLAAGFLLGAVSAQADQRLSNYYGDYYGGGFYGNSECQNAIDNLRYWNDQVVLYRDAIRNDDRCDGKPLCRAVQFQAFKWVVEKWQDAERLRREKCGM